MVRLFDTFDKAIADPSKDIHFALELDRLFESVEDEGKLSEDTRLHLDEMDGKYLLPELVDDLENWYNDSKFQYAVDALDLFEDGIADAKSRNWLNVTTQYQYRRIRLKAGLGGHNPANEIEEALEFLENHPDTSGRFTTSIIKITIENISSLSNDLKDRWIALIESLATTQRADNRFNREREYLRLLYEFKGECGRDPGDVEDTLIDSYRTEADLIGQESQLQKADILQSGVSECSEYMNEGQKRDWKQEALQARRSGTEHELHELDPDELNVDGIEGESLQQAIGEEIEHNTQVYMDWFKQIKRTYDSGSYALYCLVLSDSLIPDPNKIRLSTEEYVVSQLLNRRLISPEAHTLSVDPSDPSTIPSSYGHYGAGKMSALGNALYRLIKEDYLTVSDFIHVFRIGDTLSPDTEAFLTNALFNIFDEKHLQAQFLLIPHLEAVIVETLESIGRPTYTIIDEGTRQQLLGGLFIEGDDVFGRHYSLYLRYRYTSRQGMNLRNRLAHGQLRYRNATYLNALLTLFDIVKCMITINISDYLTYFGIPQRTLSPATHYERDTDLSLFTDLNKQLIGYGISSDGHTLVVIREDHHEDETEIFVDKGRIKRYRIDKIGLNRDELHDEIDELRDDNPNIPDSITYSWLDQDDLVLHTVEDVIDDEIDAPAESTQQEKIIEEAKTRGIDESTTRIGLQELEKRGEIITTEIDESKEILLNDEKVQIFDHVSCVTGIGETLAWRIASHFDSEQTYFDANKDDFHAVSGVGPNLANRMTINIA